MRPVRSALLLAALAAAGCGDAFAQAQPVDAPSALGADPGALPVPPPLPGPPEPTAEPLVQPKPLPHLGSGAVADAERLLRLQMRLSLGSSLAAPNPAAATRAFGLARGMLRRKDVAIDRPQILLLVDRAPAVQRLWVVAAQPGDGSWTALGAVRVSTGKPGRKEHFKTPVGVFENSASILGYRAQGTFNENHIRGNGLKGMRVWDFGWQTTEDWRKQAALTAVRLEMHATDPTFLEGRLGRPDSEACIRIPASFNQFMDRAGLIDAQLLALVPQDRAVTALLPKDGAQTALAGDKVVVVDSSEPDAIPSDPVMAEAINQRFADWLAAQNATPPAAPATVAPAPGGTTLAGTAPLAVPVVAARPSRHPTVAASAGAARPAYAVSPKGLK